MTSVHRLYWQCLVVNGTVEISNNECTGPATRISLRRDYTFVAHDS